MLALLRRESGLRWPDTRCDAVVGRWTLGSGVLAPALNLADPHWLLARSGDPCRPDLQGDGFATQQRQHRVVLLMSFGQVRDRRSVAKPWGVYWHTSLVGGER